MANINSWGVDSYSDTPVDAPLTPEQIAAIQKLNAGMTYSPGVNSGVTPAQAGTGGVEGAVSYPNTEPPDWAHNPFAAANPLNWGTTGIPGLTTTGIPGMPNLTPGGIAGIGVSAGVPNAGLGSMIGGAAGGGSKTPVDSSQEMQDFLAKNSVSYKSPLDSSGALQNQYKAKSFTVDGSPQITLPKDFSATKAAAGGFTPVTADATALDAMRNRATSAGDSPWLRMQKQQNELQRVQNMDTAGAQAQGAAADARSQLAMRGGLDSGAAERIAMGSARGLNANQQGINRQAQANALGLGIADDQTKMGLLSQVSGQDLSRAGLAAGQNQFKAGLDTGVSEYNAGAANDINKYKYGIGANTAQAQAGLDLGVKQFNATAGQHASDLDTQNVLAGLMGENQFNLGQQGQKMSAYGASKQGDAIANAGKK